MHLRVPESGEYVTQAEAEKLKDEIGAFALVECSAERNQNIATIFHEAVRAVMKKHSVKRGCSIL